LPAGERDVSQGRSISASSEAPFAGRRAAEVVALGGTPPIGFGAAGNAFGSITGSLAIQLGAGVRFGEIPAAEATFLSLQLGGGATWKALRAAPWRPIEVDLRADVFGTDLVVHRAGVSQSRWVPEARAMLEGCWFVAPNAGLVLAAGLEATLGTTGVVVGNDIVATIHPFRAVGALGGRVGF
jgi:hypothetical protein